MSGGQVGEKTHSAAAAALLEGSTTLRQGRADVFRQRERTKRRRLIRAILVVSALDAYLRWRYSTGRPLRMPTIPEGFPWEIYVPAILLIVAIGLMVALPLLSGRSPHITVFPEQVEVGLTDISGLDSQVDEVIRSLNVFLGYATFRDELGGTPRRGILFEGPPGTGKTHMAKAMARHAGVPFLFVAGPAFQSMFYGMTARKIRKYFKQLKKVARREGGAIGFIEEIDAFATARGGLDGSTPLATATGLRGMFGRRSEPVVASGTGGTVNELLIQMQSFDSLP